MPRCAANPRIRESAAPGTDGPDVGLRILGPVRQGTKLRDAMG